MSGRSQHSRIPSLTRAGLAMSALLVAVAWSAPSAFAAAPAVAHWKLESHVAPTSLPPEGEGVIFVTASNVGDGEANVEAEHITLIDRLPAGVEVIAAQAQSRGTTRYSNPTEGASCTKAPIVAPTPVVCTFVKDLAPYEEVDMKLYVKTHFPAPSEPRNKISVTGAEAPGEAAEPTLAVNGAPTSFGVESLEVTPENEEFEPDTEAGSHPFQLSTTFNLNQAFEGGGQGSPTAPDLVKNLNFKLPPGLLGNANDLGNPNAVQQCPEIAFGALEADDTNDCPEDTAVGVAAVTYNDPKVDIGYATNVVPVFNLVPAPGEPARFGFEVVHVPVVLDTSIRTGGDYGATVSVHDASQAVQLLDSRVTFWGTPGDARHDEARGWECLGKGAWVKGFVPAKPCTPAGISQPTPFLLLPTSCGPLRTTVEGVAWDNAPLPTTAYESPSGSGLTGCGSLEFNPSIETTPATSAASTPTGMTVGVTMPQPGTLESEGKAEADISSTTLELPNGLTASASSATGLETCSPEALGFTGAGGKSFEELRDETANPAGELGELGTQGFTPAGANCPDAAKLGTVEIKSALLEKNLKGSVYLGAQDTDPFASPLALYIVAEEERSKVLVKLAGEVKMNPATGQLTSVFKHTPQAPFETLKLHLFNTERATEATPAFCGEYTSHATFTTEAAPSLETHRSSSFQITSGPGGSACPGATLPFSPGFQAGVTNSQAAQLHALHADDRKARRAAIATVDRHAAAARSGREDRRGHTVPRPASDRSAADAQLDAAAVRPRKPDRSHHEQLRARRRAGHAARQAVPHAGARRRAVRAAGLDRSESRAVQPRLVNVRSRINVDPNTAAVTVKTVKPIPTILDGVPVQLKSINVTVDRPGNEPSSSTRPTARRRRSRAT